MGTPCAAHERVDAQGVRDTYQALGGQRWERHVQPGERHVPAAHERVDAQGVRDTYQALGGQRRERYVQPGERHVPAAHERVDARHGPDGGGGGAQCVQRRDVLRAVEQHGGALNVRGLLSAAEEPVGAVVEVKLVRHAAQPCRRYGSIAQRMGLGSRVEGKQLHCRF